MPSTHASSSPRKVRDSGSRSSERSERRRHITKYIANGTPADANKYVANADLSAGSFTIGTPGLLSSHIDNDGVTIGNNYTGNFAFHRYGIHMVTRLPKMPDGGDIADDVVTITDPYSGLSFQVALYRQYRQVVYEVAAAWGTKAVKSDFIATLLG